MRVNLPGSHVQQSFDLTPDAYVDLFRIDMNQLDGQITLGINDKIERVWQGITYEFVPVTLTETGVNTQGESKRPKFTVANPDGLFSAYIAQGKLDNATITRYRVLLNDVTNNAPIYQMNVWRVSKVLSMIKTMVTLELRSALDGQQFYLPARAFYPPEYPHVSL